MRNSGLRPAVGRAGEIRASVHRHAPSRTLSKAIRLRRGRLGQSRSKRPAFVGRFRMVHTILHGDLVGARGLRLRLWHLNRPDIASEPISLPRLAPLVACGLIALAGVWMIRDSSAALVAAPHWDAYLRFALKPEAKAGHAKPDLPVIEHLRQVTAWTPGDARAHLALAEACLQHFERVQAESANAMPLGQIRDAALASRFESRPALDAWLAAPSARTVSFSTWRCGTPGRTLLSCPLEGQAYIYLAELCFLNGSDDRLKPALIDQALRVRPHTGSVLMSAGSDAALAGDLPRALEFWRRALRAGPVAQRQFMEMWAGMQLPVEVVLNEFDPDLSAARLMQAIYAQRGQDEQVRNAIGLSRCNVPASGPSRDCRARGSPVAGGAQRLPGTRASGTSDRGPAASRFARAERLRVPTSVGGVACRATAVCRGRGTFAVVPGTARRGPATARAFGQRGQGAHSRPASLGQQRTGAMEIDSKAASALPRRRTRKIQIHSSCLTKPKRLDDAPRGPVSRRTFNE